MDAALVHRAWGCATRAPTQILSRTNCRTCHLVTGSRGLRRLESTYFSQSRRASGCRLVVHASGVDGSLPPQLKEIVTAFQMVPDPKAKYQQLLYYGQKLSKLPDADHVEANKVKGCVSQVWVVPHVQEDGTLLWQADSDSALTKGLAALLVRGLTGCTPEQIVAIPSDFIEQLGLKQSLTPSRSNGFLNMFRMMQQKSLELLTQQAAQVAKA